MKIQFPGNRLATILFVSSTLIHVETLRSEDVSPEPRSTAAAQLATANLVGPYLEEALLNNPELAVHQLRYEAARASIPAASALPNPRVQLTHFVESIQTRTGPQRQAISLQQAFPRWGSRTLERSAARARSESLWYAYLGQQFSLVDRVAEQITELAYLEKATDLASKQIELLVQLEDLVETRVRAGNDLSDLLLLQIETESARDQLARLSASKTAATSKLNALLGQDPQVGFALDSDWSAPHPLQADPQQWLENLKEAAPSLAVLRSLASSEEARASLAELANRPELSLGLNYIRTGDGPTTSLADNGRDPWAIVVGLSLPIWGKANTALERQASLQLQAVQAQLQEEHLALQSSASALIAQLRDSESRIQRYDTKLIPLARQHRDIEQTSYEAGKVSLVDLIESERAILTFETDYWKAASTAWRLRWKLAILSGGLWLD